METRDVRLGALGQIITGKTPPTKIPGYYGGDTPFLTPSDDMNGKYAPETARKLSESGVGIVRRCLLPAGSICMSCIGSGLGKVVVTREPLVTNQQINSIIPSQELVDLDYLYYSMLPLGRRLNALSKTSTAVPIVNKSTFSDCIIALPDIRVQRTIGHVLATLDQKIEINRRTNDYLAAMCDAVFSERFGGIGDNAVLSDVANITMGQSPSGKSYNEDGNGTVFYQGRGEFGWRFPTQRLFTTEPKRMAAEGDVLMSVRAPVGDLNVAYEDCCIGRGLAAIHSQYPSYCLYLMRSLGKKLDAYNGEGTVFGSINGKALNGLEIGLPDADAIKAFEAFAQPIDQQIRSNVAEERSLATLRDALLPKLMSGEIDVSQIVLPTQPNNHLSFD